METFTTRLSFWGDFCLPFLFLFFTIGLTAQNTIETQNEDKDGDGISVEQGDCDDYQPLVYPGANEIEDGQDNNCDGIVDAVEGDCDDFTDPGQIAGSETICGNTLPSRIENEITPSGGTGDMQIMWIYTTDDPEQGYPEWYIIPNAHDLTYQPNSLNQTTWFGRCVRRSGCWKFPNESNIIKKLVETDCQINECEGFTAEISNISLPDCAGNLGAISLLVNGTAPFEYQWSDGSVEKDRINLSPGFYEVVVRDANGCTSVAEAIILEPDCAPICNDFSAEIANTIAPDCDGNLGSIDIQVNNGATPLAYQWSDGADTEDRNSLIGGFYDVTITDANGCLANLSVGIPTPTCLPDCSAFSIGINSSNGPDCDGNLGSIDIQINNGTMPINYQWSDGATTEDRTELAGGSYSVTATDANGCIATIEVNIPTPTCLPDCSAFSIGINNSNGPDCDGNLGSIDIQVNNGSMPINYQWSDGATTEDRTGLAGGSYSVTATDANGCIGSVEVNLPTPTCLPDCSSFSIGINSSNGPDCDGNLGSIDIQVNNGSMPISYQWLDGATTEDRTGLAGGSYSVTATDANGCIGSVEVNLPTPTCLPDCSAFSIGINASSGPDCDGNLGSIDIQVNNGTMPINYQWSDGAMTEDRTGLVGGSYGLTATDANGCVGTLEVNLATPTCGPDCSAFSVTINSSNGPDCDGNLGNIDLQVNNGTLPISFQWSDGANSEDRTGLQGGNFIVTVSDVNGCSGIVTVDLPTPTCAPDCSAFSVFVNNSIGPDCDGNLGSIDIQVTNGTDPINYQWSDGAISEDRTGLEGGNYMVTITDANGCSGVVGANLATPTCAPECSLFAVSLTNSSDPDCEGNMGSIDISFVNGLAPITYQWSDGNTQEDRSGLAAGNYQVTLTDANGCMDNLSINLSTPDCSAQCSIFDAIVIGTTEPDCDGNLGSIDLSVQNGLAPISFAWQDGANTEDRAGLEGGAYVVTVSDANGCFDIVQVNIPTPNCSSGCDDFIIPFTIQDVTCSENSGAINLSVFGGTPPYNIMWSDGFTSEDRFTLTVGIYDVTVTDSGGCSESASITVGTGECVLDVPPFTCNETFYQMVEGQFSIIDLTNNDLIPLGPESDNLNPLGYNVEDDFIYGIKFGTTDLVRIGSNGNRETIGIIQGINVGLFAGDFDLQGNYYLLDNAGQQLHRLDISNSVLAAALIELSEEIPSLADVSYNPIDQLLYGISEFTNDVFSINPISGQVQNFNISTLPVGPVGSTWMTNKGELVINYNVSGDIYFIDITTQTAILIGNTGSGVSNADGANCVLAPSPFEFDNMVLSQEFSFVNVAGTVNNETARIQYEVENDAPDAHYVLEHSIDGTNFKALPSIKRAKGKQSVNYKLEDKQPILGSGFYRVKYVTVEGDYVYSDLVPLLFHPDSAPDVMVHPNPFTDEMVINFIDPLAQNAKIMVVNNLGVIMETCGAAVGDTRLNIACSDYPPGLYTIYIKSDGKRPIAYRTLKAE